MAGPPAPPPGAPPTDLQGEAAAAREHLSRLRASVMRRTLNRRNAEMDAVRGRVEPPAQLPVDESKFLVEQVVARALASHLLDPRVLLPMPVETMHKQVLQGANGDKYAEALAALGLETPLAMVARLSGADAKRALDTQSIDLSGHMVVFISRIDRKSLVSFTGIEDPLTKPAGALNMMAPPLPGAGGGGGAPGGPPPMGSGGGIMGPSGLMGPPPPVGLMHGPGGPMMMMGGPRPPPGHMQEPFGGPMGNMMGNIMMPGGGMLGAPPPGMFPPPPGGGGGGMMMGGPGGPGGGGGGGMMPPPPHGEFGGFKRTGSPPPLGLDSGDMKRLRMDGSGGGNDLDALLGKKSVQERVKNERGEELLDILAKPTAKEHAALTKFRTTGGSAIREHCPLLTKEACRRSRQSPVACHRLHFRKVLHPWTDPSLGNCSYLDTCRNQRSCRFVHYELDADVDIPEQLAGAHKVTSVPKYLAALDAPQWLRCDVRTLDMSVLGKFGVIMADPPWEIHQHLPYGTMGDDEMRNMNIGVLQDDGVIFLWVTGRAMELGRECLQIWGYKRVDELLWIKTNQLQRLIRTGRTGHWLNHSKEHCLVGIKGNPQLNRYVDCDVVVAEVRETSRKPDEMYPLLERLSPGTRKLEIFARGHNLKPGWVGLGNQLDGSSIRDPVMRERFEDRYPVGHPERDSFGLKPL